MEAAERMKAMRERRRARGLRELRLIVPDARSKAVRNGEHLTCSKGVRQKGNGGR